MGRDQIFAQLREAVRAGDCAKAKDLEAQLDAGAEDQDDDEAADVAEVDHDAELDEAAEEIKTAAGDETDETDENDEDDLEESEDEDEDEDGEETTEAAPPLVRAAQKQRQFAASKEAAIKAATGRPTGTVQSGAGSFVKPAGGKKRKRMREAGQPSGDTEVTVLRETVASLRAKNARLSESLRVRASADRAKKLLRESNLPKEVRPHLIDVLLGKSDEEMRREIKRQERIIEAAARRVKEDLFETDFDAVEGAGSHLRESYRGPRDGSELGDILAESGLPMKAKR